MMTFYAIKSKSCSESDELSHHGIEGQKWGVRRGPPYPIEDKVMRKGEHLRSTEFRYGNSEVYKNNGRPMYTYNAKDEWDNKVYKGPFAKYNVMYRGARFIAEHEYELVKDLKMPTKEERMNEFKDIYNSDKFKKTARKEMQSVLNVLIRQKVGNDKEQEAYKKLKLNKLETKEDWNTAYAVFNHAMEAAHAYKTTSEYMKNMSEKYDAMVDDNNQGVYNKAHDPVIIFRANEALKSISTKFLTINEIKEAYNSVANELHKEGINVKL